MRWLRDAAASDSDPGLAPLIDVVLLLLIFFMVTTSFRNESLTLELPDAENGEAATGPTPLLVELDAEGAITVDGEAFALENLGDRLRRYAASSDEDTIELRADRATQHGAVIQVLDAARSANIEDVALAVERGAAGP